ncbi:hypothetical protein Tco_1237565 [Tanacetum coccineum]
MRLMEGEYVGLFNLGNPGEFTMLEQAQGGDKGSIELDGQVKCQGAYKVVMKRVTRCWSDGDVVNALPDVVVLAAPPHLLLIMMLLLLIMMLLMSFRTHMNCVSFACGCDESFSDLSSFTVHIFNAHVNGGGTQI